MRTFWDIHGERLTFLNTDTLQIWYQSSNLTLPLKCCVTLSKPSALSVHSRKMWQNESLRNE